MIFDFPLFISYSGLYVALATTALLFLVLYNPRLMLQDYPPAIKETVPPKTEAEKRQSIWLGLPFILILFVFPIFATFGFQARAGGEAPVHLVGIALHAGAVRLPDLCHLRLSIAGRR